jgi:hypothetical protein
MTNQISWSDELVEQIRWHWTMQLRPRLDGLSDEEYFWEPTTGCWTVRPAGQTPAHAPVQAGSGAMRIDFAYPEPDPAPITTIAWRLGHVIVGVLGARVHAHFGGPAADYMSWPYAATADEALQQLDAGFAAWVGGVGALGEKGLATPCGPAEGPWADRSMATLILHINRELIHHGAEAALLRDLFRAQPQA